MTLPLAVVLLACAGSGPADSDSGTPCVALDWFLDQDSDGYGADPAAVTACSAPDGHVGTGGDCDDTDAAVSPGADEVCDGLDNDCDGVVDPDDAVDALTCFRDADGDGYGGDDQFYVTCICSDEYLADSSDCDDGDATVYPGAAETWYDGIDGDCAGGDDDDADGDGFSWEGRAGDDCDDSDPDVNPGVIDVCDDGIDNDCDDLPATCGLSGTVDEEDADLTVMNEYVAIFGRQPAYAGDSDGDGLAELLFARAHLGDEFGEYDKSIPLHDFVLIELPPSLDGDQVADFDGGVDALTVASFRVPDPHRQWYDTYVWTQDEPPVVANVDLDGDGTQDYIMGSVDSSHDSPGSRIDIWHGPATGEVDLTDALTLDTSSVPAPPGISMVLLQPPGGLPWAVAAVTAINPPEYGSLPAMFILGEEHFDGSAALEDAPQVYSWDRYDTGRGPDAADVDGDGIGDLLVGTRDRDCTGGHASTSLFLGPVEGSLDAFDADLVIDQTAHMVCPKGSLAGGWSHVLITSPEQEGTAGSRIAVAIPGEGCDGGEGCGQVFVFDFGGSGWQDADDATLTLVGPPESKAGHPTMKWGGDVDDDGIPELIVLAQGSSWPDDDGQGGAFVVEPPLSGTFYLEDADVVVRHDDDDTFQLGHAALGRHSLDGDEWDDLLITDRGMRPAGSTDIHGGFYVFRGGPYGY